MATIKLPDLETLTDIPQYSDFLLIRRNGLSYDNKIKYYDFVSNIIPQLTYYHDGIAKQDVFSMRRVGNSGGTEYLDQDRKITFENLYKNINNQIKSSDNYYVSEFISSTIKLKITNGLEVTSLKLNSVCYFTPKEEYSTTSQILVKVDNVETTGELLSPDLTPIKILKKDIEIKAIYDGTNFIISSSTYYVNKPFRVETKSALPSASNNNGVIYFVEDVNKLVMSINSKWMILATATTELS